MVSKVLPPSSPKPADRAGGSWVLREVLVNSCGSACSGLGACPQVCVRLYRQEWQFEPTGAVPNAGVQLSF
jgi:hypothetical protein